MLQLVFWLNFMELNRSSCLQNASFSQKMMSQKVEILFPSQHQTSNIQNNIFSQKSINLINKLHSNQTI